MGKKKKALEAKKRLHSKIFMGIFLILAYFTGLSMVSAIAYADLELCRQAWAEAFNGSQGPVGFVLGNFNK